MIRPPRIAAPGTYDLPAEIYHADPAPAPSLSSTVARKILFQSPLHAWAASPRLNPHHEPEIKGAFEIGRAAHTMLMTKGAGIHVMSADNYRTKDARDERDEAREAGLTVLLPDQHERVAMMVDAARFQLGAHGIGDVFSAGESEQSHFAEVDGVWVRAMTDCMVADSRVIYDYKTTAASAAPEAAIRTVCSYGYDVQAAHYLDTVRAVTGQRWRFRFVIQEKADPFALSVVELDESWLTTARKKAARARELWRMCLDRYGAQPWPGYPSEIAVLSAPAWHDSRWFEREEAEADYRQQTGRDVLDAAMAWQAPVDSAA